MTITIKDNKNNTIRYSCDCGIIGECILKPQLGNKVIVVDIRCPHCEEVQRIKLLQYDSEEAKEALKKKDVDLSWAITLENNLKG